MEKLVSQKEAQKRMEDIENEIYINKEKARADASHYALMKTIEAEHA
jgi:erlin